MAIIWRVMIFFPQEHVFENLNAQTDIFNHRPHHSFCDGI